MKKKIKEVIIVNLVAQTKQSTVQTLIWIERGQKPLSMLPVRYCFLRPPSSLLLSSSLSAQLDN